MYGRNEINHSIKIKIIMKELKQTLTEWQNENNDLLFQETIYECELPRIGEKVKYGYAMFEITDLERNFDEQKITITVRQF